MESPENPTPSATAARTTLTTPRARTSRRRWAAVTGERSPSVFARAGRWPLRRPMVPPGPATGHPGTRAVSGGRRSRAARNGPDRRPSGSRRDRSVRRESAGRGSPPRPPGGPRSPRRPGRHLSEPASSAHGTPWDRAPSRRPRVQASTVRARSASSTSPLSTPTAGL